MCIREGVKDWHSLDMRIEDIMAVIPYLADVDTVILQGWGEPLLHKRLIDIIGLIKGKGPHVGFITCGKGLNRPYIEELIGVGTDFICFSLAGTTARTHDSIRINSDFHILIKDIRTFGEIKKNRHLKFPRLSIVYLLLKDNISEVVTLPDLAKDLGVEDITLINLIHVTNEWQEMQRIFVCNGEVKYEEVLKAAEIKAKRLGIGFRRPPLRPIEIAICEEDPLNNLYISVGGEVSPCVFLYSPAPSPFIRVFCGNEYEIERLSFGNIFKRPFNDIWNSAGYREFRECFIKRKRVSDEVRSYLFDPERFARPELGPLPEPPANCRTCHKMLGL